MELMQKNIAPGFKKTELGVIPEDWKVYEFDTVFNFLTTASYSRNDLSSQGETIYIHYGDIHTKWNHFIDFEKSKLPKIDLEKAKGFPHLKNGDLIIVDASEDYNGIGKSVEVRNLGIKKAISGLHTFLLRDKKDFFANGFKGYLHSNKLVKNQYDRLATGLKVYGVTKTNLKSVLIPLPDKKEQQAIAKVLSETDQLIEKLSHLIEKKKAIKQGTMQSLLTRKKRLKGFNGKWKEKKLPEIIWFQEGPGLRNWQFQKKGIKVINVTNLENGYLNLSTTDRHISKDEFSKTYKHFEIDENDVVMASSGNSYGKLSIVRKKDLPLLMNTSVIRFKPLKGLDYNFMVSYLKPKYFKDQIDLLITGGAQPNFGPVHLKKIIFPFPKIEEQQAIAQILTDMDKEIEMLEQKLLKYQNIKQGMLTQLLTGKIRLL